MEQAGLETGSVTMRVFYRSCCALRYHQDDEPADHYITKHRVGRDWKEQVGCGIGHRPYGETDKWFPPCPQGYGALVMCGRNASETYMHVCTLCHYMVLGSRFESVWFQGVTWIFDKLQDSSRSRSSHSSVARASKSLCITSLCELAVLIMQLKNMSSKV